MEFLSRYKLSSIVGLMHVLAKAVSLVLLCVNGTSSSCNEVTQMRTVLSVQDTGVKSSNKTMYLVKNTKKEALTDPGFPRVGANSHGGSANRLFCTILAENCMKRKNLDQGEGSPATPLGSANGRLVDREFLFCNIDEFPQRLSFLTR